MTKRYMHTYIRLELREGVGMSEEVKEEVAAKPSWKDGILQLRKLDDAELGKGVSGSGTQRCWTVEARAAVGCSRAKAPVAGMWGTKVWSDHHWERVGFKEGTPGVPAGQPWDEFTKHGFYSYAAAQALRWWFVAEQGSFGALDTRLVEYEFKYSWEAKPLRTACDVISENREDIMPDWGKKESKVCKEEVDA